MPARTALAGKDGFPPDAFLANVAKEMNLSETAFVKPRPPPRRAQQPAAEREAASESSDADSVASGKKRRDEPDHMDYDLRWFTPSGTEVDLCGHATLATAHALFELGPGAVPPRPVSDSTPDPASSSSRPSATDNSSSPSPRRRQP